MHLTRFSILTAVLMMVLPLLATAAPPSVPDHAAIDAEVARLMRATQARGMAVAVINAGQVVHVAAYGKRNAAGEPLQTDSVMYGASLTKAVFGYYVMQLVDDGQLDLDRPLARYLAKPLPDYPDDAKAAAYINGAGLSPAGAAAPTSPPAWGWSSSTGRRGQASTRAGTTASRATPGSV